MQSLTGLNRPETERRVYLEENEKISLINWIFLKVHCQMCSTSSQNFENLSLGDPVIGGINVYDTTLVHRRLHIDRPITKQTSMLEVEQQHKHIGTVCYNDTFPVVIHRPMCNL